MTVGGGSGADDRWVEGSLESGADGDGGAEAGGAGDAGMGAPAAPGGGAGGTGPVGAEDLAGAETTFEPEEDAGEPRDTP